MRRSRLDDAISLAGYNVLGTAGLALHKTTTGWWYTGQEALLVRPR